MKRVGHGDHAAFEALVDRHGSYLYGVAHALTGNTSDAEDVVQETLMGALRATYRGEAQVRTWLVRILVNQAGMLRRTRSRRGGKHAELDEQFAPPAKQTGGGDGGVEAKVDLSTMLQALSPEHRQIIVLRELEGLSYEEMAKTLGVPRGTVESRLFRAREELRKKFKGYM